MSSKPTLEPLAARRFASPESLAWAANAELLRYHHEDALYLCALVLTGDHDQARDLTAQCISLAVVDPASTDPSKRADPLRTRRDLARSVIEIHRQHPTVPAADPIGKAPTSFGELVGLLEQLTHLQRAALALCVYGDHSAAQAAIVLGISAETCHQLLISGLGDLAQSPLDSAVPHTLASAARDVRRSAERRVLHRTDSTALA